MTTIESRIANKVEVMVPYFRSPESALISSMLPDEERKVVELAKQLDHHAAIMGVVESECRGHLNLSSRVRSAYMQAYRDAQDVYNRVQREFLEAVKAAELASPGCTRSLTESWMFRRR